MSTKKHDDKTPSFRRKAEEVPEDAQCWICHEHEIRYNDETEAKQSLKRDCACRGTMGYAHWSCLIQYAINKIQDEGVGGDITRGELFTHDHEECYVILFYYMPLTLIYQSPHKIKHGGNVLFAISVIRAITG